MATELNETNGNNVMTNFHINNMPLHTFRDFKKYADDYNGSYAISIKTLLDKAKVLEYIMGGAEPNITEVEEEEPREEIVKINGYVPTLGDDRYG